MIFSTWNDEVRSGLQEPAEKFFTNVEIDRWLNYGIKLFARETHILKATADYTWAADAQEVALSTVINSAKRLRSHIEEAHWKVGTASAGVTLNVSMREVWKYDSDRHAVDSTSATPKYLYYNPYADKIGLYPTPSDTGTLTIFYSYEIDDYDSDEDTDALLDPWYIDICAYAIGRGQLKDVDHFSASDASISNDRFQGAIRKAKMQIYLRAFPNQTIDFVRDYPEWD